MPPKPFPSKPIDPSSFPRHPCSPCHPTAAKYNANVTFCGIQLEIAKGEKDIDIEFNRGKSLEDLFFNNLSISGGDKPPPAPSIDIEKSKGRREHGEITVTTYKDFLDMESSKESTPASVTSSSAASASNNDQLKFISGNPFVEVTKGVLHLYKENQTTSLEEGILRSQMLCMLGVPAKIKTPDLLAFTSPCHSQLEMMRILQDNSPNQFMVLLRFRCQEAADEFYQAFNGQKFNSLEEDVCSLVYVSKVETCKESEFYPMAGHTELPLCSICLERMDESISTVLTILCNHTFHGSCLAQWEDTTCPVCRYVQTPEVTAEQRCSDCNSDEDLWICLVCGYVGCGRYVGGHSHAHFMDTQHSYTMELGQNRVWDYVGDNFVHRLMQTDGNDGKLVEAGGRGADLDDPKCVDGVAVNTDERLDSIQLEYTYLLTSQLEAQRRYYEEKITRVEQNANHEMEELTSLARKAVEEKKDMEQKLSSVTREKSKSDQKLSQLSSKVSKMSSELSEEKQLNVSLRSNQSEWQKKCAETEKRLRVTEGLKDAQISELQDQLRDLMINLDAGQRIAESDMAEEIKQGSVAVGAAAAAAEKPSTKVKKRRAK